MLSLNPVSPEGVPECNRASAKMSWENLYPVLFFVLYILGSGTALAQGIMADTSRLKIYHTWERNVKDPEMRIQLYTRAIDSLDDDWAHYYRGMAYLNRGRYTLAENDFWAAINFPKRTIHPAWPYLMLAQKYFMTADYRSALRFSTQVIESNDSMAMAWRIKARSQLKLGNTDAAFEDLQKAIYWDPENPENLWERSGISLARSDFKVCLEDVNKLLKIDPNNPAWIARKAWCLYQLGDENASAKMVPALKNLKLQDSEEVTSLGDLMFIHGELEAAERYYTTALIHYENQILMDQSYAKRNTAAIYEGYLSRGIVRMDMEKKREALNDFNRAAAIKPQDYRTYLHIGELQTFQGNYLDAITAYDQAMRLNPACKSGWLNYGYCYSQLERYKEALTVFSKGILADSTDCLLYNNRGFTYLNIRNMPRAFRDIERAISLCPDEMMPYVSMGEYYFLTEEYETALSYLNKAINLPGGGSTAAQVSAYYTRGRVYLHKRELVKAKQDLDKALLLKPDDVEVTEILGITLYRMEKFCEALEYFRRALSLDARNDPHKAPNAAYYISMIHDIVVKGCP